MTHQFIENKTGRTFFVGDIHGCYSILMAALSRVDFNPQNGDILVCVGDLIDRGSENIKVLELLYQDWFYSVEGNHEELMLDSLRDGECSIAAEDWFSNGGFWYFGLSAQEKKEVQLIAKEKVAKLPIVITVKTLSGHSIGVVHSCVLSDNWQTVIEDSRKPSLQNLMIWNRSTANLVQGLVKKDISKKQTFAVKRVANIDAIVFGHTPMKQGPVFSRNMAWIDTGAVYGHRITLLEDKDIIAQADKDVAIEQWKYEK